MQQLTDKQVERIVSGGDHDEVALLMGYIARFMVRHEVAAARYFSSGLKPMAELERLRSMLGRISQG